MRDDVYERYHGEFTHPCDGCEGGGGGCEGCHNYPRVLAEEQAARRERVILLEEYAAANFAEEATAEMLRTFSRASR